MAIRYSITQLRNGSYKLVRLGNSGRASRPLHFDRAELEQYLVGSVSKEHLQEALRTLDATGQVIVEADLET